MSYVDIEIDTGFVCHFRPIFKAFRLELTSIPNGVVTNYEYTGVDCDVIDMNVRPISTALDTDISTINNYLLDTPGSACGNRIYIDNRDSGSTVTYRVYLDIWMAPVPYDACVSSTFSDDSSDFWITASDLTWDYRDI